MSKELSEEERQKLEEAKAMAWIMGQKITKQNFNEKAFINNQKANQLQIDRESREEFTRNLNRSMENESKKRKKPKTES